MSSPADCRFTESHEWVRVEGDLVTIGITKFAADELTDVTYAEMRPVGTEVAAGDVVGEVESVKTTSDIYAPVAGTIEAVNDAVSGDPSLVNSDPFGSGWLVQLRSTNTRELSSLMASLMDHTAYDKRYGTS